MLSGFLSKLTHPLPSLYEACDGTLRECTHQFWEVCPGRLAGGRLLIQRRQWHPTPVLLPGKSHGRRNLVGCSPWGREESNTTEQLHFRFSLSCTGEGNGNPLQSSCLENPRDRGAWCAAVYGVAQSRTWLKWLSSNCKNGLPSGSVLKRLPATQEMQVPCLGWKDPLEEMTTHSRILGKFHGQRSLTGYNPWSHKQSDMT